MPERFPNIETLLVGLLTAALPDAAHVATKVPRDLHPGTVRVQRLGGTRRNLVRDAPLVVVQVWHSDAMLAERLCEDARQALLGLSSTRLTGLDQATGWVWHLDEVGAPVEFPDPDRPDLSRYQTSHHLLTKLEIT